LITSNPYNSIILSPIVQNAALVQ